MDRRGDILEPKRELNCCFCSPGAEETEVVTMVGHEHANCCEGIKGTGAAVCAAEVRGGRLEVGDSLFLEV